MCLKCQGWSNEGILDQCRRDIAVHGWGYVHVESGAGAACLTYTVGLTRYHGHPELAITGLAAAEAVDLLADLATEIRAGTRLGAGDVLTESCCARHRLQLVEVEDPRRLDQAQRIYAGSADPVPALQVVYTDDLGHWPWEPGWTETPWRQPLLGRPRRR